MKFIVCGPFKVARKNNNLVDSSKNAKRKFWDDIEAAQQGIAGASGCYVFALQTGRGILPWYVGKAEKQSFSGELFALHKLHHFNDVLATSKGTPLFYLIPRITPTGKLCKPTKAENSSIRFLETMLIGMAVRRNPRLKKHSRYGAFAQALHPRIVKFELEGLPRQRSRRTKKALALK